MLSTQMLGMLITSGVVGCVLGFLGATPYLKKKGVDVTKVIDTTENVVKAAEPVINIASTLIPNNPAVNVLKSIEKWGIIGAGYAQQLSYAEEITKDKRAEKAKDVVNAALKELNIEIDDNRKILMDAAIKDAVNSFGHADPTEVEKQAQLQQLQTEKTQLVAENQQLKQKIDQVTNLVSTTITNPTIL
jgi:hypothetical protein